MNFEVMASSHSTRQTLPLLALTALLSPSNADIGLSSSCVGQEDGGTWLKMMADTENATYPAVRQMCSNEMMVINVNEDPNVKEYFSSFQSWHYALSGPINMDFSNWEEWWLPSRQFLNDDIGGSEDSESYFQFAISPDCSSCDLDNNIANNNYSLFNGDSSGERTAYYMTGTLFGCLAKHKALKDCRWDYDSYTCGYCTMKESTSDLDYHVMFPEDDDWSDWIEYYQNQTDAGFSHLQMSLCGVWPTSSFSDDVP